MTRSLPRREAVRHGKTAHAGIGFYTADRGSTAEVSNLDDARGADVDAEVVHVDSSGTKRMLTVRFTTAEGRVCEGYFRSMRAEQTTVRVGDVVRIHHPKQYPCSNVREADDSNQWGSTVVAAVLVMAFGIGCIVAWGAPITMPPQRYADMP